MSTVAVDRLPSAVREIENLWIPLSDGKRDGTRWRDEPMHRYFAGHAHAAVRVDLRGTGESGGA